MNLMVKDLMQDAEKNTRSVSEVMKEQERIPGGLSQFTVMQSSIDWAVPSSVWANTETSTSGDDLKRAQSFAQNIRTALGGLIK